MTSKHSQNFTVAILARLHTNTLKHTHTYTQPTKRTQHNIHTHTTHVMSSNKDVNFADMSRGSKHVTNLPP